MSSQTSHDATSPGESPAGRLSRWFSIRRGSTHQYDVGGKDVRDGRANSVECEDKTFNPQQQQQQQSTPKTTNADVKMPLLPEVFYCYPSQKTFMCDLYINFRNFTIAD